MRLTAARILLVMSVLGSNLPSAELAKPPKTAVEPVTEDLHGTKITDPYRWLEDQDSPRTRAWLTEQNAYTQAYLKSLPGREKMEARLSQLMKVDVSGMPRERGGRYFLMKRAAGQNQYVLYMREGLHGKDEMLIDGNTLSPDQTSSLALLDVSHDGKLLAYGVRKGGEDEVTLYLYDVDKRAKLNDMLPRARYSSVDIRPDRKGFYYVVFTPQGPRIRSHEIGSDAASDTTLFGNNWSPQQLAGAFLSEDGHYLVADVATGVPAEIVEVYVKDLRTPESDFKPVITGIKSRFDVRIYEDKLYVLTDWEAPKGRVLTIDLKQPDRANWKTIVPEGKGVIDSVSIVGGQLFTSSLEDVVTHTAARNLDGSVIREIKYPTLGTATIVSGRPTASEGFYTFNSFAFAPTVYHYDVKTGKSDVFSRVEIPFNSDDVEVKQVWYESKDKTRVPMFLAYKKGVKLDGSARAYLTAYGGFNISLQPVFSAKAAYWVEQGGIWAVPNLRGGGEFGEAWHKAGMFEHKQNVFDDFISAAEYLVSHNYTRPSRLAIEGGSNGGLLVGAAVTQRPDLYGAVVCAVPLLDMIRFQMFKVGRWWTAEYGSAENAEQFPYLLRYSPYHNVKDGTKYPAIMFVSGDSDTRVDPLHARKMTARMQAANASGRPILLNYDTKGGHSGGLPVSIQIEKAADELSFLMDQLK